MRISDWSSDVCSSDLDQAADRDAMPGDRRLQRMIVRTETRPFVDRQSVHPGEPRPSPPVGRVGGLAPFDMEQGGIHQVLRPGQAQRRAAKRAETFRKKRPRSEEHTSQLQSPMRTTNAVICSKQKSTPYSTSRPRKHNY